METQSNMGINPPMFVVPPLWSFLPCQIWRGPLNRNGYGFLQVGKQRAKVMVHKLAWMLEHGPVPRGMVLDHLCRNRACTETSHLEPVSVRENTLRGEGPTAKRARAKKNILRPTTKLG